MGKKAKGGNNINDQKKSISWILALEIRKDKIVGSKKDSKEHSDLLVQNSI